ncbi:MAG: flagellar basal body L-ring protein FlgH [Planctomycetota bacterium]
MSHRLLTGLAAAALPLSAAAESTAQQPAAPSPRPPRSTASLSFIAVPAPEPRPVQVHDIVTILVSEQAEQTAQSQFNRQRRQSLEAELAEFVRITDGALRNSASTSPTIDGSFNGQIQNNGIVNDREGLRFRIAATVVSILPNGNVVLEARKTTGSQDDAWEYTLTGTIAADKINQDMTAISEDLANARIFRYQTGRVADSTKRSWGTKLIDTFSPF